MNVIENVNVETKNELEIIDVDNINIVSINVEVTYIMSNRISNIIDVNKL